MALHTLRVDRFIEGAAVRKSGLSVDQLELKCLLSFG